MAVGFIKGEYIILISTYINTKISVYIIPLVFYRFRFIIAYKHGIMT